LSEKVPQKQLYEKKVLMMDLVYRNKKSDRIIKPEKEFYVGMKKKDFTDHELDRLQLLRRSRSPEPIVRVDMGL
jgi:hypothetical protein